MILYGSKFRYGGDGITGAHRLHGQFMGLWLLNSASQIMNWRWLELVLGQ